MIKPSPTRSENVPCVLVTNSAEGLPFENLSSVTSDDTLAAAMAIQGLLDMGHTRIAVIGGNRDYSDIAILVGKRNEAVSKFVQTLKAIGIPVSSDEKHDLTQKPYIMEVMNFIKFVCNPNDDFVFFPWISSGRMD